MEILRSLSSLKQLRSGWNFQGYSVAFVPTMGFLHAGHLSLVRLAKQSAAKTIVSLFVNPLQFGPSEDFERYPRNESKDLEMLESAEVDAVFIPEVSEFYPPSFETEVRLRHLSKKLCGLERTGHFDGVATVVLKLFNLVRPERAIFGEKDYQQLVLIRQMTKDLNLDIEVLGGAIVRDPDGLALSSRNVYLSVSEREQALGLFKCLKKIQETVKAGEKRVEVLKSTAIDFLNDFKGIALGYFEILDADDLSSIETIEKPARAFVAAKVGKTRLIDNITL